jgi:hypothetical protein
MMVLKYHRQHQSVTDTGRREIKSQHPLNKSSANIKTEQKTQNK